MTKPFTGFSSDKQKTIRVPEGFFDDVLPHIGSLLELKVTLYLFWRLARGGPLTGSPRIVSLTELQSEDKLKAALAHAKGPRPFNEALREGLELAVGRGTILQLRIAQLNTPVATLPGANGHTNGNGNGNGNGHHLNGAGKHPEPLERVEYWFLLNTRDNKAWVEALGNGEVNVLATPLAQFYLGPGDPASLTNFRSAIIIERPNVYTLYEQNIGLLTPIMAEKLQDAEGLYPQEWINAAFEEAVLNNKRNWRYIERILERWTLEGRQSGKDRGSVEQSLDIDKYTKGKYAFLFKPDEK
jgi:DnaD/phage-associated family protein